MAVGIRKKIAGVTAEQVDRLKAEVDPDGNPPDGLLFHASVPVDGGWGVIAFWESREQFRPFRGGAHRTRTRVVGRGGHLARAPRVPCARALPPLAKGSPISVVAARGGRDHAGSRSDCPVIEIGTTARDLEPQTRMETGLADRQGKTVVLHGRSKAARSDLTRSCSLN